MKDKPSMQWVLTHHGIDIDPKQKPRTFIHCPSHSERTASCQLHMKDRQNEWYYCFGCGASGDSISLIAAIQNRSVGDVLKQYGSKDKSWKRRTKATKNLSRGLHAKSAWNTYQQIADNFWTELNQLLLNAPDWLLERTVLYWSERFDTFSKQYVSPKYRDKELTGREIDEALKRLQVECEEGLAFERRDLREYFSGQFDLRFRQDV